MLKKILKNMEIMVLAFCSALNYTLFVFPNKFAPSGIDGICTMIQDVFYINMGYFSFFINIPLLLIGFFVLKRDFAVKTALYVCSFSVSAIFLNKINLTQLMYISETGAGLVLAPIAAGTIRGILYAATLKLGGSSGGIDIISALLKKKKPHLSLMSIIFYLNVVIALSSYFVYGMKAEPVILSIIYSFITKKLSDSITHTEEVKYEVITYNAEALCGKLLAELNLTSTVIDAKGAYSGNGTKMVICVSKKEQAPFVEKLATESSSCAVFKSTVSNQKGYLLLL